MIKVKKLKYRFESTSFEFNFDLNSTDIVGVLGKSGSGKSTLFNLLAGFLSPNDGSVFLNGKEITFLKPPQRNISILFQDHNNFNHLSIFENIILGIDPEMEQTQSNFKIVKNIMKKVSLNIDLQKKVSDLSGGEQQRVSIARALLNDPKLILADEPTGNLDPETSEEIMRLLIAVSQEKKAAIIMATHDMHIVKLFPNRTLLVENGNVTEQ